MRHRLLTDPGDPAMLAEDEQFMFGPSLLAAPVSRARRDRQTVRARRALDRLLATRSASRSERRLRARGARAALAGGRETSVAPRHSDELPLLIRAGAVLPMLPAGRRHARRLRRATPRARRTSPTADDRLRLLAFPRGRSSARFYQRERLISRERADGWALRVEGDRRRTYRLEASLATLRDPFVPCSLEASTAGGSPVAGGRSTPRHGSCGPASGPRTRSSRSAGAAR